jgi:hypothetical protein
VIDPSDLYGVPLERFTAERNALAKQLRREGRREEAAAVGELRKPSVAAWAVNQLVRTQGNEVAALFEAGDALKHAQSQLVAGRGNAGALRHASEAEREAIERLTHRASGLLSSEGHALSPAKLEQVSETLHAAALDEAARAQVHEGCLQRELRHIGLGALGTGASGTTTAEDDRQGERARRKAARSAEAAARRRADRAARDVEVVQERRDRAAGALQEAEEALAAAREVAQEAARELESAQQAQDEW